MSVPDLVLRIVMWRARSQIDWVWPRGLSLSVHAGYEARSQVFVSGLRGRILASDAANSVAKEAHVIQQNLDRSYAGQAGFPAGQTDSSSNFEMLCWILSHISEKNN